MLSCHIFPIFLHPIDSQKTVQETKRSSHAKQVGAIVLEATKDWIMERLQKTDDSEDEEKEMSASTNSSGSSESSWITRKDIMKKALGSKVLKSRSFNMFIGNICEVLKVRSKRDKHRKMDLYLWKGQRETNLAP